MEEWKKTYRISTKTNTFIKVGNKRKFKSTKHCIRLHVWKQEKFPKEPNRKKKKKISLPRYNILKCRHKIYILTVPWEKQEHTRGKKMVLYLEYSENVKKYRLVRIVSTHGKKVQIICSQIFKHITNH